MDITRFMKNIAILGNHLEKNEKYMRRPEKKVMPVVRDVEKEIQGIEKKMNEWEKHLE